MQSKECKEEKKSTYRRTWTFFRSQSLRRRDHRSFSASGLPSCLLISIIFYIICQGKLKHCYNIGFFFSFQGQGFLVSRWKCIIKERRILPLSLLVIMQYQCSFFSFSINQSSAQPKFWESDRSESELLCSTSSQMTKSHCWML